MSKTAREAITQELYTVIVYAGLHEPIDKLSDRIITALDAAGFIIVPKEPNERIYQAANGNGDLVEWYRHMIAEVSQEPKP